MPADSLGSPARFRQTFEEGLVAMLAEQEALGAFILVLANAAFDAALGQRLNAALASRFAQLAQRFERSGGKDPALGAQDDREVFARLLRFGLANLPPVQFRQAGIWELQFNQLRAFRPLRNAGSPAPGICKPFDPSGFHFAKPFMAQEMIWRTSLAGRDCALFYNKFPFVPLHGLLVPDLEQGLPQFLRLEDVRSIWEISLGLGQQLPGIGFGYSSTGACSSVNHLHVQSFVRQRGLPVEDPCWSHNGGDQDYPVDCEVFSEPEAMHHHLQRLHQQGLGYNLLLRPGRGYCLTRAWQASRPTPQWTAGLAWYELAGGFVCFDSAAYHRLQPAELAHSLSLWRV